MLFFLWEFTIAIFWLSGREENEFLPLVSESLCQQNLVYDLQPRPVKVVIFEGTGKGVGVDCSHC